jgi:hypothetical protein
MIEQLLIISGFESDVNDDHDLPFPTGTPFKGVVRAKNFITGDALADEIGLVQGISINSNAGWLHFVEENGYNIYLAKKPLRFNLGWPSINNAQLDKEIVLDGKTFNVEFITGMRRDGLPALKGNAGGAWNRYIYNVYGGERADELPNTRLNWGSYTEAMLGIPLDSAGATPLASFCWVKELDSTGGHATRGVSYSDANVPNVMGVWYGGQDDIAIHYAWRPMLVEKGTFPPVPVTPFKGEVAQADFITFSDLATAVGVTEGTPLNTDAPWLKIELGETTYYWPKASIRGSVLRETLNTLNLVTGDTTVIIGGLTYKVRLIKGRDAAQSDVIGEEWLEWLTHLTNGDWAEYSTAQLVTGTGGTGNGELVLTQELAANGFWAANGYPTLLGSGWYQSTGATHDGYGWRPVLELVP